MSKPTCKLLGGKSGSSDIAFRMIAMVAEYPARFFAVMAMICVGASGAIAHERALAYGASIFLKIEQRLKHTRSESLDSGKIVAQGVFVALTTTVFDLVLLMFCRLAAIFVPLFDFRALVVRFTSFGHFGLGVVPAVALSGHRKLFGCFRFGHFLSIA